MSRIRRSQPGSFRRSRVVALSCAWLVVALGVGGCELFFSRDEKGSDAPLRVCEVAEGCCAELEQAGAYGEVGDRAGKRQAWPNHCPSWQARSTAECTQLIEAVASQRAQIEDDHPVFEASACEAPR